MAKGYEIPVSEGPLEVAGSGFEGVGRRGRSGDLGQGYVAVPGEGTG